MVDWPALWVRLFGSVDGWFGIDWGFWVSMIVVALFVVIENVFFWTRKPFSETKKGKLAAEKEKLEAEREAERDSLL